MPSGFVEVAGWLAAATVIVGLHLIIRRTRNKARRQYLDRRQREEETRRNDPDMRDDN